MDLRRLSICLEDERNARYVLQNAKLLEKLYLSVQSLVRFHDILSPSARTLKFLEFTVFLCEFSDFRRFEELWEGLEAMAGNNILEALSFEAHAKGFIEENSIGSEVRRMEKVLVKPGWSALRQVSFKVTIARHRNGPLNKALVQSPPDKHLSHLLKLESVIFNYSTHFYDHN